MFLIHKLQAAIVCAAGFFIIAGSIGCQRTATTSRPEPLNETPLVVDEAIQLRDWERSTAYYPNGAVVAGNTGFFFEPDENLSNWQYLLIEPPLFVLNVALLPVSLVMTPPCVPVVYEGAKIPPTYTAQVPLP